MYRPAVERGEAALQRSCTATPRTKLNEKYGDAVQPATGPIRADLLGNMWAQEWGNIYDVVAPKGAGDIGYDLDRAAGGQEVRRRSKMVKTGEGFYTSLGFAPLPETFWTALAVRQARATAKWSATPRPGTSTTRTTCASRCAPRSTPTTSPPSTTSSATITTSAPTTQQPYLYLNGANDGFHEAIGDFIALSITPEYLVQIGLLDRSKVPGREQGHRPAAAPGDGQGRLPAVRPAGRQMALGRVRRLDHAGQLQPGLGRPEARVSGHRAAGRAVGDGLRSGRQVPHPGQHALHALLPRPHPAVPVLQGGLRHVGLEGPAAPLLLLRQQGSRPAAERRCWRWARRSRGPTRSRPSPARARCRPSRCSNISRRCRPGSRSRTAASSAAGDDKKGRLAAPLSFDGCSI